MTGKQSKDASNKELPQVPIVEWDVDDPLGYADGEFMSGTGMYD